MLPYLTKKWADFGSNSGQLIGENRTKKSSPGAEFWAVFRHKISEDQKQKKVFTEFELVFVLPLSKVEKTKKNKDFYWKLRQIRLNFDPDHLVR